MGYMPTTLRHSEQKVVVCRHFRPLVRGNLSPAGCAIGILLVTASLVSCDDSSSSSNLTESDAIDVVNAYLFGQSRPSTTEQITCHMKTRQERRPCTQFDVDADPNKGDAFLARCKPIDGSSAVRYGSKIVAVRYKDCGKETVKKPAPCPRPAQGGQWTAQYLITSHEWRVVVVGSSRGKNSWSVDDTNSAVTSHQPPC